MWKWSGLGRRRELKRVALGLRGGGAMVERMEGRALLSATESLLKS